MVLFGVGFERVMEPRYGGKGIREWIDLAASDSGSVAEVERALKAMGPRAVPHLLEIASRSESWKGRMAAKVPAHIG